jgi:hypothetical protein
MGQDAGWVMFVLFKGNRYHDRIGAGSGQSASSTPKSEADIWVLGGKGWDWPEADAQGSTLPVIQHIRLLVTLPSSQQNL